jgi:hypothetical protein
LIVITWESGNCCIRPVEELPRSDFIDLRRFRTRKTPAKLPIIINPPTTPPTTPPIIFFELLFGVIVVNTGVGIGLGKEREILGRVLAEDVALLVAVLISRASVTLKKLLVCNAFFSFYVNFKEETSTATSM